MMKYHLIAEILPALFSHFKESEIIVVWVEKLQNHS